MLTMGSAEHKARVDSERNQGRAPDMGWLDHDRLGFNYRLTDIACAIGLAQLERLDGMLADRARVAGWYREALAGIEGSACRARTPAATCAAGSSSSSSSRAASTATRRSVALRERGVQSKPYLPAIHLMSFYRERFGHREGEFPVCEDVAARSIALPFFPRDDRGSGRAGRRGAAPRCVAQRLEVADEAGAADRGRGRASSGARRISRCAEAGGLVQRAGGVVVQPGVERDAVEPGGAAALARRSRAARAATPRRRHAGGDGERVDVQRARRRVRRHGRRRAQVAHSPASATAARAAR